MADHLSPAERSENMRKITSKNTLPEKIVRSFLHIHGFRYRLHVKRLPGSPDIVLPKYKTVIFVHGCFWHQHSGCPRSNIPKSNKDYWIPKLEKNIARFEEQSQELERQGWSVIVVWECSLKKINRQKTLSELVNKVALNRSPKLARSPKDNSKLCEK